MLRRRLPWIALLATFAVVLAVLVVESGSDGTPQARAQRLGKELRCPTCQGLSVADSREESAEAIKADIAERIEQGQSDAEIREAYVERYGEQILLKPDSGGLGVLVWGLPAFVIVLGGAGVVYAARRSRREPQMHFAVTGDRDSLEAELEFLRRSLDDLESERAAGELDDETFVRLHGEYRAGIEALTAALEREGTSPVEPATPDLPDRAVPRPSALRRVLTVAGVVAFAVAAALVLTAAVGDRRPGQTATGNDAVSFEERRETFAANVEARPDDYAARIAYARFLLNNDRVEALKQFDAAAGIDPSKPEPKAYAGWILGISAGSVETEADRRMLVDGALDRLDTALELAPDYPDAHVFKGLVLFQVVGDAEAAIPYLQRYLQLAPSDDSMREVVLGALARAVEEAPSATTTVPPSESPSPSHP